MRVFQKKQNKEKEDIAINNSENITVEKTEVITEEVKSNTTTKAKKLPKSVCRVIVATPSYFVINKNGETITVKKKNNYHRGEEIYY